MSVATYRGVKYDTNALHANKVEEKKIRETYRGIRHTEQVRVQR